jgi:competence protein ComEA
VKHGVAGTTRRLRSAFCYVTLTIVLSSLAAGCARRSYHNEIRQTPGASAAAISNGPQTETPNAPRINLNTASADELENLPGIGKGLAARIIEHREKYGPFRKPAHLIIVRGISDKRFHALQDLITVE